MNNNDAVQMIGHDDEFVQFDFPTYFRRFQPFIVHDTAARVQFYSVIDDGSNYVFMMMRAKGQKIGAGAGIIVSR
jgi:hypothetical protein